MAVEMEKEKHELVTPKPSNSWKSTGIPFGTLDYLRIQTNSSNPSHTLCQSEIQKANRKPNKRA